MSSTESSEEDDYILYRDRPEWRDINPVDPEDEFPHQVVRICYSQEFKDCFDYFRSISEKLEYSPRALQLTEDCIRQNPANYTVREYRRRIIKALNIDLKSEFEYTGRIIAKNIKNFQVWHHRQILCQMASDGSNEVGMTNLILAKDEKNYHAWQHRQWAIKTFDLFEGELEVTVELLKSDVYNNSAWNHRYFIHTHTTGWTDKVFNAELDFVIEKIKFAMDNESCWNYLRAILEHDLLKETKVYDFVLKLWENERHNDNGQQIRHLAAFYVDMTKQQAEEDENNKTHYKDEALSVLKLLTDKIDPIRKNYWNYLSKAIADI